MNKIITAIIVLMNLAVVGLFFYFELMRDIYGEPPPWLLIPFGVILVIDFTWGKLPDGRDR